MTDDTNEAFDVFVRDLISDDTERISVDSTGSQGSLFDGSYEPAISSDGRYVAFTSEATNLVPNDTNGAFDVFVRDRIAGTTGRVSVDNGGIQGTGDSFSPDISDDGRYVVFDSFAHNLAPGGVAGVNAIYIHDRQTGVTERISVDNLGVPANGNSRGASISADGQFTAFWSNSTNLAPSAVSGFYGIYVRDRVAGTTQLLIGGLTDTVFSQCLAISIGGRYVAFDSSSDFLPEDTNGSEDVFVQDRQTGLTDLVSLGMAGEQASGSCPAMTSDGRFVVFESQASNLVPGDTNLIRDVFVRDIERRSTLRINVDATGQQANSSSDLGLAISADGTRVAFSSYASNLVTGDANTTFDIFVAFRDDTPPVATPTFTPRSPAVGGVLGLMETATRESDTQRGASSQHVVTALAGVSLLLFAAGAVYATARGSRRSED